MTSEWRTVTVGEFAPFTYGKGLPASKRNPIGRVPVFGSNGIVGYHDSALTDGPTIIIGRKGTAGAVHYSPVPCWPIDTTFFLTGSDASLLRFKYYALRTLGFEHMNSDSAVPGLNRDAAHARELRVLKESEQRAIAHILGTLDDKIELNRRMNETLAAMAQTVFKSWFINFDPVIDNAIAAGNPIPEAIQPRAKIRRSILNGTAERKGYEKLSDTIRQLFPSAFEYTAEIGYIPKGWVTSTVGDEFDVTMGQSPPGTSYNEEGNGIAFFQGRADFGFRYPTNRVFCTEPKRFAQKDDTLVSVRAPVGDINMAQNRCCIGRGVAAVRHRSGSRSFTYYSMRQLRDHFSNFEAEGTVFGSISQKDFKALNWFRCDPNLINIFDRYAWPFDQKIAVLSNNITTLSKLRDTLLPKLVSGELRLREAEEFLESELA